MSLRIDLNEEESMEDLFNGVNEIIARTKIDHARYMELYTAVYQLCNMKKTDQEPTDNSTGWWPFNRAKRPERVTRMRRNVEENITSQRIIRRIDEVIDRNVKEVIKNFEDQVGEDLIKSYLQEWDEFSFTANVLNGICGYINRYKLRDITTYDYILANWKRTVFSVLNPKLTTWILTVIEDERKNGVEVPKDWIKNVIKSFIHIAYSDEQKLGFFKKHFEDQMIEKTEEFYKAESLEMIQNGSISKFMERVEEILTDEENRGQYLHSSTMPRLLKVCENILIKDHVDSMNQEFQNLLNSNLNEDSGRMFRLISRLGEDSLDFMKSQFKEHVFKTGLKSLSELGDLKYVDPKDFGKTLIDLHQKYTNLVETAFESNRGFSESFNSGFRLFLNNREYRYNEKSPELLALYCGVILKKSSNNPVKDQDLLEDALDQVMIFFNNLDEKDVFQSIYGKVLASRLITQKSASFDAEVSMIGKLKLACGFEYTMKYAKMYQDIGISNDLNDEFKTYMADLENAEVNPPLVDFHALVLSPHWSISQIPETEEFITPNELTPTVNFFNSFYNVKYSGRRLTWLYNLSRGELVTNGYKKKYTFIASTYQMAILLMYNSQDNYTIRDLVEATHLGQSIVIQIIQNLLRVKLLLTEDNEADLKENSKISVFIDYKNSKLRLNINKPLKPEKFKNNNEEVPAGIRNDRKNVIQCAIVRIMKSRNVLKEKELISEVVGQLSSRFIPTIEMVKESIRILVDKEYLKDGFEGGERVYTYLAS